MLLNLVYTDDGHEPWVKLLPPLLRHLAAYL